MSFAPKKICAEVGCPTLVPRGVARCEKHAKAHAKAYEAFRGTPAARGYTSRWAAVSRAIRRQFPLCGMRPPEAPKTADSECERRGETVAGELVDHIRPVTGPDDPGFFDSANHQVLCWKCHQIKRGRERHAGR